MNKTSGGSGDSFSNQSYKSATQPCPLKAVDVTLTHVTDTAPIAGSYVLERPDGSIETGELQDGMVHRDDALAGNYKVHLPSLSDAAWDEGLLELPESGKKTVGLHFSHRAIASGTATIAIAVDGAHAEEPLHTLKVPISASGPALLEAKQEKATWDLSGLPALGPGDSCGLVFEVRVGALVAASGAPLVVGRQGHDEPGEDGA
jgi:hypothetical protein